MEIFTGILLAIICLILGLGAGYWIRQMIFERDIESAHRQAQRIIAEAQKEAQARRREAVVEAREELSEEKKAFEKESREVRQELIQLEKQLANREESLDKRAESFDEKEREIEKKNKTLEGKLKGLDEKEEELRVSLEKQRQILETIAGITEQQARQLLLENLEHEMQREQALIISRYAEETKEIAKRKAREILVSTIQRIASEEVQESTVSTVPLPSDDMKGRIIGREGRNIRAFESVTGINLIIDDTPEAVVLSGFDPIRREAARQTLERLLADGRIHPGRIEEIHHKVLKEMDETIKEAGETSALDAGVPNLNPDLIRLLGRMKYRTSYGQNVLAHSVEVAHISTMLANELGADPNVAKRAGLLHDIGKSIDWEMEGSHVTIGVQQLRRCKEKEEVIHAVEAHHGDVEPKSVEAVLVQIADAVSASRPGARRETLETYIKRLEQLEAIATSFKGVEKSFAISAGREVRIVVEPSKVDDIGAAKMARDISKRIEEELQYPGQIKVTVLREMRATEYAR
ncbi:MAG: ribonuclease Y [Candidatus Omnitrophica bacterium]|nr:MAG: Ribonuclease Y [Candidatus Hinthialibacteria bacterium OLB16]MBE7489938.1 ribonuclease Y [bacterium]MBK7496854.1 ribonuclease Y [Candidatus Omnitrophota bacterium]MCE7910073.1 ribonuclease Y [Candidatus Omnitrophica bacterium COP1]MBV6481404.1 Ribonuclease Y [bacterium]